jgi:hypothetical protein
MDAILNREIIIEQLSKLYFKFLNSIDWTDEIYLRGINEGRNKFLSNTYLNLCHGKHSITNFQSMKALNIVQSSMGSGIKGRLIFEHMIPKEKYIQKPCEEIIRVQDISDSDKQAKIKEILTKYWFIASISVEEDKSIRYKRTMPPNWDGVSLTDRYDDVGIIVLKNKRWI